MGLVSLVVGLDDLTKHLRIYSKKGGMGGVGWISVKFVGSKFCTGGFAGVGFGILLFATPDDPSNVWKLPSTYPAWMYR